jgi:GT2 family glycosyltransferase
VNALLYGRLAMKLSIIIVNYNVKYFLEQCLHSVVRAAEGLQTEIIVVDNASSDGSIDYLQPLFPSVHLIASKKNLGFGRANNLALQQAKGEYVLFLNPDTIVPEDCFKRCISFFEHHPKAGALGIRMLDGSGSFLPESKRSFPSTSTAFFKAVGLADAFPKSKFLNKYSLGYLDEKHNHPVDVLAGAFVMIRKCVLDEVGGFDEQFFMYGEDIDLSYRIKKAGFENWYFAETPIIHFKGESMKKWSADHVKVFYEAMIVFVKKHYQGSGAGLLKLLLIGGIRLKSMVSLLKGSVSHQTNKVSISKNVAIIGTDEDVIVCKQLYLTQPLSNIHMFCDEFSTLQQFCIKNKITQLVFCSAALNSSTAISLIDQLGNKYSYRFHASGSNSFVGSDHKSELGEALALK